MKHGGEIRKLLLQSTITAGLCFAVKYRIMEMSTRVKTPHAAAPTIPKADIIGRSG